MENQTDYIWCHRYLLPVTDKRQEREMIWKGQKICREERMEMA